MLPLPAPQKVKSFRVRFRFQLLSSKRFRFHKNLTAFTASASTSLFEIVVRCNSFMRHKVVDHKVIIRQVNIMSYSPVIQIKLYVGDLVDLMHSLNKIKLSCLLFPY